MSVSARLNWPRPGFTLDVDLDLPGHGISGLLGPSGSGKTSLLRAIAGLERVPQGRVCVNGEDWQNGDQFVPVHQRPLGYVFQQPSLFPHLNVQRNLEFGLQRLPLAERRISLEQVIEWLGLECLLQRDSESLSGGEAQRVAIARALAVSPRLLLLDEPLASLDLQAKSEIMPYLKALHRELEIPMLYVSHAPDELAELADHLVMLDGGRVAASGALPELFTRLELPLAHLPGAAAVLEATVAEHLPEWQLSKLSFAGGQFSVPRVTQAPGQRLRVRILARDVSLALALPQASSILNCLPVAVRAIADDGPAQVLVQLDAGGSTLLSRVTRKSAADLGLHTGQAVYAQFKTVSLLP